MSLHYLRHPPEPPERQLRGRLESLGVKFTYTYDAYLWLVWLWLPSVLAFAERKEGLRAVLETEVPTFVQPPAAKLAVAVAEGHFEVPAAEVDPAERALQWLPRDSPCLPTHVLRVPLGAEPEQAALCPAAPNGFFAIYCAY
jgi:hypothetical protein